MKRTELFVAALVIAGTAFVTGCSLDRDDAVPAASLSDPTLDPAPPIASTSDTFNDTDVMFLQMMVEHHAQGVEIAHLARDREASMDVLTLAGAIEATQVNEIETMAGWLRAWNQLPRAPSHVHEDHGGMPNTDHAVLERLRDVRGAAFDREFLHAMIARQDDAVQLSRLQARDGVNPQAADLAEQIATSRAAQIDLMLGLLEAPE